MSPWTPAGFVFRIPKDFFSLVIYVDTLFELIKIYVWN